MNRPGWEITSKRATKTITRGFTYSTDDEPQVERYGVGKSTYKAFLFTATHDHEPVMITVFGGRAECEAALTAACEAAEQTIKGQT